MKKVSIVIVNWNGIADTARCLRSISHLQTNGVQLSTIVVDNGSRDKSVERIRKEYPWVHLIALANNLGFSGGNNVGIEKALQSDAQYVWLLNNDTIVDRHALCLVDGFTDESIGIIGSKIYFAAGYEYHKDRYTKDQLGKVFWYAGGVIDWNNMYASHRGVDEVDDGQYDKNENTPFVTGCSMMIKKSVIESIGVFDNRFFLYLEDVDYCLRAQRHGYRLVYFPQSVVWHQNSGSTGGAGNRLHEYYITRNRIFVGLVYAPMRTKIALIRESLSFLVGGSPIKKRAVIDAALGKWGNQYEPKKLA